MTAAASSPRTGAAAAETGWSLRRLVAIDERPAWIAAAGTRSGQALIALLAAAAIFPHFETWETLLAVAAATAAGAMPARRAAIVFAATWSGAFLATWLGGNDTLERVAAALARENASAAPQLVACALLILYLFVAAFLLRHARLSPDSRLARHPLLTLLAAEGALCALALADFSQGLPRALLWSAVFVFTPYLWFLPYAIADQRSRDASPPLLQLGLQRPFWSPSYLPFGKGAAFLRKHLAKTPEDLAVTRLKAVKLLLWANALYGLRTGLGLAAGACGVPALEEAVDLQLAGGALPPGMGWAALLVSATRFALQVAIWAHLFVGIARLAGYRLPRGCWRPLESRTLMDYFNRFHYYFKELLVDFFFVPTFFRVFRRHPRLRMFFATFMAAGVGNALWHFVRDIDLLAVAGPAAALESYASYAFYCLVLATGVGLSQVRANLGIRPPAGPLGRLRSFLFVWSFVVCMHVFSDGSRSHSLGERFSFLAHLFGANQWI